MTDFMTWLARARAAKGMSIADLSAATGLSKETIHSWSQCADGKVRRVPSKGSMMLVEEALGMSMSRYPFDCSELAASLAEEIGEKSRKRVTLYLRMTDSVPCYVGYRVAEGEPHGTVSGWAVESIEASGSLALRLLRGADR